jgi:hypothetical protein
MLRALGLILALLLGCTSAPVRDPAVVQDALEYVAKITEWAPIEATALTAIRDVRRSQFVDDDYVIATLGNVIDDIELHLAEIDAYQPRTRPVLEVHERYRRTWHDLHDAFAHIIESMERKDYVALAQGTDAMGRARAELVTVAAALNLLLRETGIKEERGSATAS